MSHDANEAEQRRRSAEQEAERLAERTAEQEAKPQADTAEAAQSRVSRRFFLSGLGAAGLAVTAQPLMAAVPQEAAQAPAETGASPDAIPVTLNVNGKEYAVQVEPRVALLDCLRETLDLPGTKKGCDHGQCGACTVHVNGRRVLSCMSFAWMHAGDKITTIEGLGQPEHMHPMQAAFVEHDAYQCGYCTSGQIMSATALLSERCGPSDADVKNAMYGNICRCGAYPNIVAAVQQVRRQASPTQGGA